MALEKTILGTLTADDGEVVTLGVVGALADVKKLTVMTPVEAAAHQAAVKAVFDLVAPKPNWKAPIRALIPNNPAIIEPVRYAIEFFTGTEATFQDQGPYVLVTAPGYYGGPCN